MSKRINKSVKTKISSPKNISVTNNYVKNFTNYQSKCVKNYIPKNINNKYKCDECDYNCDELTKLEKHFKLECTPNKYYRDIYIFDKENLGPNIFNETNAGDIYLIQNYFGKNDNTDELIIKIGGSESLNMRIGQYRTGLPVEPRLHYYFSVRNWKKAEKLIKKELTPFNVNGENYRGSLSFLKNTIRDILVKNYGNDFYEHEPSIKYGDVNECIICNLVFKTQWAYQKHLILCYKYNLIDYYRNFKVCPFCGINLLNIVCDNMKSLLDIHYINGCNILNSIIIDY